MLVGQGDGVRVVGNVFRDNDVGVLVQDEDLFGANDTLVEGNHFTGNGTGLLLRLRCDSLSAPRPDICGRAAGGTTVRANSFLHNDGSGIVVTGSCPDSLPPDVPPGFVLRCAGENTRITSNVLVGNGRNPRPAPAGEPTQDDGITLVTSRASARLVTITGNVAVRNADLGIEAPGAVDGGGNRAAANGDRRNCLGVVCR